MFICQVENKININKNIPEKINLQITCCLEVFAAGQSEKKETKKRGLCFGKILFQLKIEPDFLRGLFALCSLIVRSSFA